MLDDLLTSMAGPEQTVRIDRLEIDLERLDPDRLEADLVENLRRKVTEALVEAVRDAGGETSAPGAATAAANNEVLDIISEFFRSGSLPWWASDAEDFDPEQEVIRALDERPGELIDRFRSIGPAAAARIVRQLRPETAGRLIAATAGAQVDVPEIKRDLTTLFASGGFPAENRDTFATTFREAALRALLDTRAASTDPAGLVMVVLTGFAVREGIPIGAVISRLRSTGKGLLPSGSTVHRLIFGPMEGEWREERSGVNEPTLSSHDPEHRIDRDASTSFPDIAEDGTDETSTADSNASDGERARAEIGKTRDDEEDRSVQGNERVGDREEDRSRDDESADESTAERRTMTEEGATWYIVNAGLIILHPFLRRLFTTLDLLRDGAFISPAEQERAVALTHYLATGRSDGAEHLLLLNKILCGVPVDSPVERYVHLTETERSEAGDLLRSAIEHWSALKNTSVDGLRESFLLRNGRLTRTDRGWYLLVERKGHDVLLERLPWSFGVISQTWMNEPVYVEW